MGNRIDLNRYNIRTDLIIENISDNKINNEKIVDNIKITTTNIDELLSKKLNKKVGNYITLEFEDITNYEDRVKLQDNLQKELKKILELNNINEYDSCLIVGLGNRKSTPDSLGPKVIDNILVTRHMFELNTNVSEGIRNVSSFTPGVMANTGIESFDIINSLIEKINPKFIIVIDALASNSIDRINKTIQITDTGIAPGSGIGNHRKELTKDTLNIPVIAIGVPTVVSSITIVNDSIEYLFKHIYYIKNNHKKNKLIIKHNKNYLNNIKDNLSIEEKTNLSGLLGSLNEEEKYQLISEVLNNLDYNLIVTPKEIDFLIDKLSETISNSINNTLHKNVNDYN